jgi:hypothetical protein
MVPEDVLLYTDSMDRWLDAVDKQLRLATEIRLASAVPDKQRQRKTEHELSVKEQLELEELVDEHYSHLKRLSRFNKQ